LNDPFHSSYSSIHQFPTKELFGDVLKSFLGSFISGMLWFQLLDPIFESHAYLEMVSRA